ncbi:hypothetical protein [Pedosphaera parvula]|uniref:Uncharacterized protein n=1 Tax=Pedosphaera parvula (strain Ellin514) TaxID=320771 RepID=B9XJC6_PEDPL|nr:hypothetical protein [Pedosphaera parvula]EEF59987.1 conserved hypothetical protein [Pedosphaera parvula Ellin514]
MQKGAYKTPALQELQRDIMSLAVETKKLLLECIADSIHATTHDFLFALQEAHDRKLGIEVTVDGVNIAAESDGLQGELFGDNGWVAKYSKYPNVFDGR